MQKIYIPNDTQEDRILNYLIDSRGNWVSAHDIVFDLWILQYNARIWGLRRRGYNIEHKLEMRKTKDGKNYKMGYFKIII